MVETEVESESEVPHTGSATQRGAVAEGSEPGGQAERGFVARTLYSVLAMFYRWAESGWGGSAVAAWGLLQSSVVPGPTEAVLVPLGLADPRRVFRLAMFAIAGSVVGGVVAYTIGAGGAGNLAPRLLEFAGVAPASLDATRALFERHGWLLVLTSTVSPLSAKVVCLAAGAFGLPFWQFLPALLIGRTVRNLLVATVVRAAGPALQRRLLGTALDSSASGARGRE